MKQIITLCLIFLLCYNVTEAQTYDNIPGPENVLVVYNSLDTTSFLVTNYYKNARNIPTSNIVALNLPDTIITINDTTHTVGLAQQRDIIRDFDQDTINAVTPAFHAWRYFLDFVANPIKEWITTHNLTEIRYIVLVKGVPFKIQAAGDYGLLGTMGRNVTVDGLLCMLNTDNYESFIENKVFAIGNSLENPYYKADKNFSLEHRFLPDHYTRSTSGSIYKLSYLVSHLDGISYEVVKGIIDRSVAPDTSGTAAWIIDYDPGHSVSDFLDTYHIIKKLDFSVVLDTGDSWVTSHEGKVMGYTSWGTHAEDGNCNWEDSAWVVDSLHFDLANGAVFNTYESFNGNSLTTLFWRHINNELPNCHHTQGLATQFT